MFVTFSVYVMNGCDCSRQHRQAALWNEGVHGRPPCLPRLVGDHGSPPTIRRNVPADGELPPGSAGGAGLQGRTAAVCATLGFVGDGGDLYSIAVPADPFSRPRGKAISACISPTMTMVNLFNKGSFKQNISEPCIGLLPPLADEPCFGHRLRYEDERFRSYPMGQSQ